MNTADRKIIIKLIGLADKLASLRKENEGFVKDFDDVANDLLNLIWSDKTKFLEFSFCDFCHKLDGIENLQDANGWRNFYCRKCEIEKGIRHSCGFKNKYHEEFKCSYDGKSLIFSSPDSPDIKVKFCPFCGFSLGDKNIENSKRKKAGDYSKVV